MAFLDPCVHGPIMLRAHGRHFEEAHLNREAPVSVQKKAQRATESALLQTE